MIRVGKSDFQIDLKNQEEWEDLLSKDGLKVIDVYQEWSGPCQSVLALFKKILEDASDDKLYFATANVDAINTLEKYRGRSEPYFLIFGLNEAHFEILKDENVTLDPVLLDEIQEDQEAHPDFIHEINLLLKDSLRCLIVAKGPEGAVSELTKLIGPNESEEPIDGKRFESIRDKFGERKANSCVTAPYSKKLAEKFLKIMFPEFSPPKVIIYMQDVEDLRQSTRPQEGQLEIMEDIETDEESSKVPEYEGPPRVIVLVKPPAYDHYRNAVCADLESNGFKILSTRDYTFNEEEAREFYADFASLSSFESLISIMTSGNSFVIMASREDAFRTLKEMLGPESFSLASKDNPDSLRGKYSSLPNVDKGGDLTWIDGTLTEKTAKEALNKFFPIEETFALLKPDSQPVWDDIIEDIKKGGFKIAAKKEVKLTPDDVRVIYEANIDKGYFSDLMRHMTSGSSLALILRAQDAVKKWSRLIGPADPDYAVDSYPKDVKPEDICLRATYGRSYIENAVHGSSTPENAKKCIQWIFHRAANDAEEDTGQDENVTTTSQGKEVVDEEGTTQNRHKKEGKPTRNGSITATELPSVAEEHPALIKHNAYTKVPATTVKSVPEASELKEAKVDDRTTFASPAPTKQAERGNNSNNIKSRPRKESKMQFKR
ncbi:hypothetical protein Aperf_G00000060124 [Anoplocephala perfoliata]